MNPFVKPKTDSSHKSVLYNKKENAINILHHLGSILLISVLMLLSPALPKIFRTAMLDIVHGRFIVSRIVANFQPGKILIIRTGHFRDLLPVIFSEVFLSFAHSNLLASAY